MKFDEIASVLIHKLLCDSIFIFPLITVGLSVFPILIPSPPSIVNSSAVVDQVAAAADVKVKASALVVKLDAPQPESVQYDRLIPHLINICKRQEDKITALEARIKALEEA